MSGMKDQRKSLAALAAIAVLALFVDREFGLLLIIVLGMTVMLAVIVTRYQEYRRTQHRRENPPVPVGTPGARQCLKCGQAFPSGTPGPCPACHGTLAPAQDKEGC